MATRSPSNSAATGLSATSVDRASGYQYGFSASYTCPPLTAPTLPEDDDAAADGGFERAECAVDLIETVCPRDQTIERQSALRVEVHVPRDVDGRSHVPQRHAVEVLVSQIPVGGKAEGRARGGRADEPAVPVHADHRHELAERRRAADTVEDVVGTAARERADRLHRIAGLRVHGVRRAHRPRELELVVGDVDGDDRPGVRQIGTNDRAHA